VTAHSVSAAASGETTITSSPIVHVERLDVPLLLGVAGEAGEVDEAEGDPHVAKLHFGRIHGRVALHVADDVLLDEITQVALVQVLRQRRRQRQDVGRQLPHLLRHFQLRHGVADQRFVDVEVKEAHLGVGDPPHRLRVDAHQLQEGDERKAGGEDASAVAQRGGVLLGQLAAAFRRGAEDDEDAFDQLRLEAGLLGHRLDRVPALRFGEELFGESKGEPALAAGVLQVLQRVPPLAHPRDHPRLGRRHHRPPSPPHRHDLLLRPPFQRARRHPRPPRRLT
jgi:hypothetical protein